MVLPINPDNLTNDELEQALDAINLIQKKKNGLLKAWCCATGNRQRKYLREDESVSSPTLSVEGMILTLLTVAYEGRNMISLDFPDAFLQADMPDNKMILPHFYGNFVDYMCQVNPDHKKNVRYTKKGTKVLYVSIVRTLYGCLESALQW